MEENKDIKKWCVWFKSIMDKHKECLLIITKLVNQKNSLNNNLERQNNDDVLFHQRLQTIIVNPMPACSWIKEFQFPA